ncbi:MAG TPA: DNA repair protein RadA, partial [Thermoleophilia bacterium]|nr:DNA repair protein RadA [Thermoleophilia bacterium]
MAKTRSLHVCSNCGYQSPRWLGRCPDCGEWNTLVEEVVSREVTGGRRPAPAAAPFRLQEVVAGQGERIPTGVGEFDRVLGGGLVRGSVVLLGGEPGIGKSSLLLQAMLQLDRAQVPVLLVSGEESPEQVRMRADRISPGATSMRMITETEAGAVIACLQEHLPQVCVVDSVQMLWSAELSSAPGSVSQIREVTGQLVRVAKTAGIALVLVGHVTKSGDLAGPRVLEHLVDSVLAFEGERGQDYRILRAVKNRFGSTNEVGVFQMTDRGLEGVEDPSELFLESAQALPGSSVV